MSRQSVGLAMALILLVAACGGSAPTAPVAETSPRPPAPMATGAEASPPPPAPTASVEGASPPPPAPTATGERATPPPPTAVPSATAVPPAAPTPEAATPTPTASAEASPRPPAPTATVAEAASRPPTAVPSATAAPTAAPTPEAATPIPTASAEVLQLAATLDEIGARVSSLRGLPSLRPIERRFMTRKELGAHLRKDLEEDRDEIYEAQRLYATLGILGEDDDLFEIILGLLGEGVLGFYEAEEERFYVVKDGSEFQPVHARTYAHEFIHGIQQQHFDFHSTKKGLEGNSDAELAFRALIEGDASLGMTRYMFQYMTAEERAASQPTISAALTQAFRSAPHVLQREYTFPYREGTAFVATLYQEGGWTAVNDAFARIPQSTEQVLHLDKYRSGEAPLQVDVPDLLPVLGEGWDLLTTDTLGEMVLRAYLETGLYATSPRRAAEGWGGDQVMLYTGPEGETVLVLSALWDTARDAREFFDTFMEFTAGRTGGQWETVGQETRIMTLVDEMIAVSLRDTATLVIVAPDAPTLDRVRSALG